MNFSLVILDLIGRLKNKNIQGKGTFQNPTSFIPVDIIQSLLHRLNFIKAEIHLNAIESRKLLVRKIKGWPSTYDDNHRYTFKLTYTASLNPQNYQNIDVGSFIIYSPSKLQSEECESLKILAVLIGENIGDQLYSSSLRRARKACSQISNDINLSEDKSQIFDNIIDEDRLDFKFTYDCIGYNASAGSLIFSLVQHIHFSSKGFATYFGVINDGTLYLDYMQSRYNSKEPNNCNNFFLKKGKPYVLRKKFLQNGSYSGVTFQFYNNIFIENCDFERSKPCFYFASLVIKNDGIPICIFLIQLDPGKVFFFEPCKKLLDYIQKLKLKEFRYIFQRRTKKLIVDPYYTGRETRIDEAKVFVLMPFTEQWSDRIWQRYIKPTVEKIGLVAERADDLYGKDIMEDVWTGILSAKVIIADITGRNPNVFYELGVAHTIGKDVIIITQNFDDIPFDINRYRCIQYEDNADGYDKLESELLKHLASRIGKEL